MNTTPTPPALPGLAGLPAPDQAAIAATLGRLTRGFTERNADLLDGIYSDDADWVNAFGSVKKGNAEIVAYLHGLFSDANFNAGQLVAPPTSRLQKVTDDVVVLSTALQVTGQLLVGGQEIALRDNHSVHVLARRGGGQWLIVSEIYSDSRTDQSYIHHS